MTFFGNLCTVCMVSCAGCRTFGTNLPWCGRNNTLRRAWPPCNSFSKGAFKTPSSYGKSNRRNLGCWKRWLRRISREHFNTISAPYISPQGLSCTSPLLVQMAYHICVVICNWSYKGIFKPCFVVVYKVYATGSLHQRPRIPSRADGTSDNL